MTYLKAVLIWLLIMAVESVNGICRELFVKPLTGEREARVISFLIALVLIMVVTWLTIRWIGAKTVRGLLAIGLMWAVLTVLFEGLIVRPLTGVSWERFLADYNLFEGNLMSLGLLYLILTPLIAAKLRGILRDQEEPG